MKRNYAGIPDKYADYNNASVVLIPVPYDGTSTWQKGADKGPDAFLDASENMELYDIETNQLSYKVGVSLQDPVKENESPEAMTEAVYQKVKEQIAAKKFVTMFGGEHSVSIGAIRAHYETYNDLTVLQLDAHADLRPEYEESKCNHACAVHEASKKTNLIQVGIRSMDESELEHMNLNKTYFAHKIHNHSDWMERSIDQMTDKVYITIDLDVFDPSECPSTGTPEPGGLTYYQVINYLRRVFREKKVVGFDIVELCPNAVDKSSDFLAAKLYYKLLSYKFENA
ncbi:MAG: agmatinase [Crocinitomicaceae bacterium]|nr:agmatinase [Crocinitomicaceae bacterium]